MHKILSLPLMLDGALGSSVYQNNLECNLVKTCTGRGGEVKFIDYEYMLHDVYHRCTFARWYQSKQVSTTMTSLHKGYRDDHVTCLKFSFATYWLMGDGLVRTTKPEEYKIQRGDTNQTKCAKILARKAFSRVFPDYTLAAGNATSVANTITRNQTKHIKKHAPTIWKDMLSSRSLRIGSITEMEMNPSLEWHHWLLALVIMITPTPMRTTFSIQWVLWQRLVEH